MLKKIGVILVALGVVGCSPTAEQNAQSTTDAGDCEICPAQTYDYVITRLSLDSSAVVPNRGSHGFNLDGRFSTGGLNTFFGCSERRDAFSSLDNDQNMGVCTAGMMNGGRSCQGGVDNQMPRLAETIADMVGGGMDIGALLQEQISSGSLAVIVRVEGVNYTPTHGPTLNDPEVTVKLYPFAHPMFASCAHIGIPNMPYQIDPRSVEGNDISRARFTYSGRIVNGRLQVVSFGDWGRPGFSIAIPMQNNNIPMNLFSVQMRINLKDGSGGNLGGFVRRSDLVEALVFTNTLPGQNIGNVNSLLAEFVDIAVYGTNPTSDGSCNLDLLDGISVGLGFETRPARIMPRPGARPMTGNCGAE